MTDLLYSNAYISSYGVSNLLSQNRIRAMLAAPTVQSAAQVLGECGYEHLDGTDDEIIDRERARTFNLFMELCPDAALAAIIKAKYDFTTTKKKPEISYADMEMELEKVIAQNTPQIKYPNAQPFDLDTTGPLLHWYNLKQDEFKVVKTILMGKRFEFSRDMITENLRGLHERCK